MFKSLFISLLLVGMSAQAGFVESIKKNYSENSGVKDAELVGLLVSKIMKGVSKYHTKPDKCDTYKDVDFCFYQGSESSSTIIYALHGFGHDSEFWSYNIVTDHIEVYWNRNQIEKPHVVSLSLGEFWTFSAAMRDTFDSLVNYLETNLVPSPISTRHLFGDSMGGFNAISWFTHTEVEFHGLQLVCPAIPASLIPRSDRWQNNFVEPVLSPIAELIFGIDSPSGMELNFANFFDQISNSKHLQKVTMISVDPDFFGFLEGNQFLNRQFQNLLDEGSYYFEIQQKKIHCTVNSDQLALDLATAYK